RASCFLCPRRKTLTPWRPRPGWKFPTPLHYPGRGQRWNGPCATNCPSAILWSGGNRSDEARPVGSRFVAAWEQRVTPAVLHHVGNVIPDETAVATLMGLLGLEEDYRGFVSKWSVLCIFTKRNGATPIEFIIPNDGPLAKFN